MRSLTAQRHRFLSEDIGTVNFGFLREKKSDLMMI